MLKIGLIGAGFMGSMHASCYKALGGKGVVISAVADLDKAKAEAAAGSPDAKIYQTGDELIEKADVDVIDICLPTYLHAGHAVKAMEKGRAVFIEKPVCLTAKEGRILLETQKRTGATVMVGQCVRLWPEYMWLKKTVDSKKYGSVVSAVLTRLSAKPTWAWNNWLHIPEQSGTVAMDMHIHDADFARYILGEPSKMKVSAVRDEEGVIQQIFSTYIYNCPKAAVTAEGVWDYPSGFPFSMGYRVKFEDATAVYDSSKDPSVRVYLKEGSELTPEIEKGFEGSGEAGGNISSLGGYFNELDYFTDRVIKGMPIEAAPLSEGIKSLEMILKEIKLAGGVKK